jgi:hypothetical protein
MAGRSYCCPNLKTFLVLDSWNAPIAWAGLRPGGARTASGAPWAAFGVAGPKVGARPRLGAWRASLGLRGGRTGSRRAGEGAASG